MSLPIILRRDARAEFDAAFDWYEGQRPGLGLDFVARIQEAFARIADRPELFGIVAHDVRRALVRRFPYAIIYRVESERILVVAVFHTSRDPDTWQARL